VRPCIVKERRSELRFPRVSGRHSVACALHLRIEGVAMIRTRTLSTLLALSLAGGLSGCAQTVASRQLLDARQAYAQAHAAGAATYAPGELMSAKTALDEAELARNEGSFNQDQLADIATRRAQLATARAAFAAEAAARSARTSQAPGVPSTVRVEVTQTPVDGAAAAQELAAREAQLAETNRQLREAEAELAAQREAVEAERLARERLEAERDRAMEQVREFALVAETARGTVITLGGELLFRSDESVLLPSAKEKLDQVAAALLQVDANQNVVIEGHADSRGSADYNHELSSRRAEAVRAYLASRGVPPARLLSLGKGEEEPVASNTSAEGRANNRRVEIVISPAQAASK